MKQKIFTLKIGLGLDNFIWEMVEKSIAFTIVAKNYLGLAKILESSVRRMNPNLDFKIFIADEVIDEFQLPSGVVVGKNVLWEQLGEFWYEMAFRYNLTEFCTSIKPFCIEHLFDQGFSKVIYLDPDIFLFSGVEDILSKLDDVKIILTPHVLSFEENYQGDRPENGILATGIFNLGFLAVRNDPKIRSCMKWWGRRLISQCYIDPLDSYFTDQKWMDFIPGFFEKSEIEISRNLGLNLAPWNYFERQILRKDETFYVKYRGEFSNKDLKEYKLCFVHFSGYDYKALKEGDSIQNNISEIKTYSDIDILLDQYSKILKEEALTFNSYIDLKYTYGYFENGSPIVGYMRII